MNRSSTGIRSWKFKLENVEMQFLTFRSIGSGGVKAHISYGFGVL